MKVGGSGRMLKVDEYIQPEVIHHPKERDSDNSVGFVWKIPFCDKLKWVKVNLTAPSRLVLCRSKLKHHVILVGGKTLCGNFSLFFYEEAFTSLGLQFTEMK